MIEIAVLDMAGTTVSDGGLVESAFLAAIADIGVSEQRLPAMLAYVRETMGASKIAVFRRLFGGDEARAQEANQAFETEYAQAVSDGKCSAIPGAVGAIGELRDAGVKVALATGFSPATQRVILEALGWTTIADLVLAPPDAGRGRPYPDVILTALLRLEGSSVRALAVVGDTASDVHSGIRAGASAVVGVQTGVHDRRTLFDAGATHVLPSVADLPNLLLR